MYTPAVFCETRIAAMHSLMQQYPLATLVTSGPAGPEAAHVPMVLHAGEGLQGILRCHVARPNPVWKSIDAAADVLAIFQGQQHYISPSWYASKHDGGQVVPTWNYVAVHVRGQARTFQDQRALFEHIRTLTDQSERSMDQPWSIDDAPRDYLERLSAGIVGIEIAIDHMEGKWKVSQNRPEPDRAGVIAALQAINSDASRAMASLVAEAGKTSR